MNGEPTVNPVPQEILTQVSELIKQVETLLQPYLVALTSEERKVLAKMGDKTVSFVNKALEYAETNKQFVPNYLDINKLSADFAAVAELTKIENPLVNLSSQLSDTAMLAGSEAYISSLMFYNSVKEATRRSVPGAKAIFENLKLRFEQARRKNFTIKTPPKD